MPSMPTFAVPAPPNSPIFGANVNPQGFDSIFDEPLSPTFGDEDNRPNLDPFIAGYEYEMGQQVARDRPADQHRRTPDDLETLRNDTYEAKQVRRLYMVSNPAEFSFADDVQDDSPAPPSR